MKAHVSELVDKMLPYPAFVIQLVEHSTIFEKHLQVCVLK